MKKNLLVVAGLAMSMVFAVPALADFELLTIGSKGDQVVQIQQKLIEQGYLEGAADGDFGPMTQDAVKAYQMGNGLDPTGSVDEATLNSIMGTKEPNAEASTPTEQAEPAIEIPEYIPLTPRQLKDNAKEIVGYRFETVVTVENAYSSSITSNDLGDGGWGPDLEFNFPSNLEDGKRPRDLYEKGDVVVIRGTVGEGGLFSDYSLDDCEVAANGKDAESRRDEIDKGSEEGQKIVDFIIAEKERIKAEEKAAEEAEKAAAAAQKAEQEVAAAEAFKASCGYLDYYDIMRNPSSYNATPCLVSGKVLQVQDGWFDSVQLRVAQDGDYDMVWYVNYTYKPGDTHVLEDDWITVYGECNGTFTYTAVLGNSITIPKVDAKYYELYY